MNPLSLHHLFERRRLQEPPLDFLLRRMVKAGGFSRFADCGAGVGQTSETYANILRNVPNASLVCYEPLPENVACLRERVKPFPFCRIRDVAVSNQRGKASFRVPSRLNAASGPWAKGTSYNGCLGTHPQDESIEVQTIRLDEDGPFDFIKLDLQGGEKSALEGLGPMLSNTPLLYVENQLLNDDGCRDFLSKDFDIVFDTLQFGFRGVTNIPMLLLDDVGIHVTRLRLADASGVPALLWGHFRPGVSFTPDIASQLKRAGMDYLQTDLICTNKLFLSSIEEHFAALLGS